MEKYIIHKEEGFIYKLNGNSAIDEMGRMMFTIKDNEMKDFSFITKEQYLDIYYAMKGNDGSIENQRFLYNLIEKTLQDTE